MPSSLILIIELKKISLAKSTWLLGILTSSPKPSKYCPIGFMNNVGSEIC